MKALFTVVDDGSKPWAHKGKPLWLKDANPGDSDGVGTVWLVVKP